VVQGGVARYLTLELFERWCCKASCIRLSNVCCVIAHDGWPDERVLRSSEKCTALVLHVKHVLRSAVLEVRTV